MGKEFQFRLQHILHLREYAVMQAKIALGEVITLRERLEMTIQEKIQYLDAMTLPLEKTSVTRLQANAHHRNAVREEISDLQNQVEKALELEVIRRHQLQKTLQEKKVIEKLRERKKMEYDKKIHAEEQQFMDEIANGATIRKAILQTR